MKVWVRTKLEEKLDEITEEKIRAPVLANQDVRYSVMELKNNECLCRIAGTPDQISAITADAEITQLTDEEARKIIKSKYPNSDLESVDVADPEIDEIAKSVGIEPQARADIQIPTVGKQLLQDQEKHLLSLISERLGLTRDQWDTYAKEKFGKLGIDIDREIREGKNEAHENVLNIIREAKKAKDAGHKPVIEGVKLVCKVCKSVLKEL